MWLALEGMSAQGGQNFELTDQLQFLHKSWKVATTSFRLSNKKSIFTSQNKVFLHKSSYTEFTNKYQKLLASAWETEENHTCTDNC